MNHFYFVQHRREVGSIQEKHNKRRTVDFVLSKCFLRKSLTVLLGRLHDPDNRVRLFLLSLQEDFIFCGSIFNLLRHFSSSKRKGQTPKFHRGDKK